MAGVARRKRNMVDGLAELHLARFKASGAELVMGEARFTEPKTVQVTSNAGSTAPVARRSRLPVRRVSRQHSQRARTCRSGPADPRRSASIWNAFPTISSS